MPMQSAKSKFSLRGAVKAHAHDETDYGRQFVDLPAIDQGIAQFKEGKIGVYKSGNNKGEMFLYLAGVVVEPKVATKITKVWDSKENGGKGGPKIVETKEIEVEGQRTSLTLPLCDTKKGNGEVVSGDENVAAAINELRKLGGDECTSVLEGCESEDAAKEAIEDLCKSLVEAKIFFKFSVRAKEPTKDHPEGGTWPHNWYGSRGLEDYQPETTDDVQDNTEEAPKTKTTSKVTTSKPKSTPKEDPEQEEETQVDDIPFGQDSDEVDVLLEETNSDDDEVKVAAENKLTEIADRIGVDMKAFRKAKTWEDAVEMIKEKIPEQSEGESEEGIEKTETPTPEVEEIYFVKTKVTDPKTKKTSMKKIEVEIIEVDKKSETVKVKDLTTKKTLAEKFAWSDLLTE